MLTYMKIAPYNAQHFILSVYELAVITSLWVMTACKCRNLNKNYTVVVVIVTVVVAVAAIVTFGAKCETLLMLLFVCVSARRIKQNQ